MLTAFLLTFPLAQAKILATFFIAIFVPPGLIWVALFDLFRLAQRGKR